MTTVDTVPAIRALVDAGDFGQAARSLRGLRAGDLSPELRAEVDELIVRLAPDPFVFRVGLGAAVMLALLVSVYIA